MTLGLILILIILCVNPFSLLSLIEPSYQFLHEWCLQKVQTEGPRTSETQLIHSQKEPIENQLTILYSAFICGERLPEGEIKKTFIALGIIHLMVISGAHLIFLERIWNLLPVFRFKNIILALFLLIYSMSAGLNPPILRALFSLLLTRMNKELKLFWSPYVRVHISGLLCLLCQSAWFHSLSFTTELDSQYGYVQSPPFQIKILCTHFPTYFTYRQSMEWLTSSKHYSELADHPSCRLCTSSSIFADYSFSVFTCFYRRDVETFFTLNECV